MSRWPLTELREIASKGQYGLNAPALKEGTGIRFIRITDIDPNGALRADETAYVSRSTPGLDQYRLEAGDILIARSGATAGKSHLYVGLNEPAVFAGYLIRFRVDPDRVIPEYVAGYLNSRGYWDQINASKRVAAQPNVNARELAAIKIPLPPLPEQRRIVDILNRANGIRRLRREAQEKARQIIPALFVEMFGDPGRNPKGWPRTVLSRLGSLDRGKSKHRPRNEPALFGGPYPFIQTGAVANSGGRIRTFSQTYSEMGLAQSKQWPVGTLCITIAANIGKTGVLEFDACFPDSVVGFTPSDQVNSEYVQVVLDNLQTDLEARAPQLAQKNINLKILRALEVPVPPLDLQRIFAERVSDIQATIIQQDRMAAASGRLVNSLMAELFAA